MSQIFKFGFQVSIPDLAFPEMCWARWVLLYFLHNNMNIRSGKDFWDDLTWNHQTGGVQGESGPGGLCHWHRTHLWPSSSLCKVRILNARMMKTLSRLNCDRKGWVVTWFESLLSRDFADRWLWGLWGPELNQGRLWQWFFQTGQNLEPFLPAQTE